MASVLKSNDYIHGANTAKAEVFNFEDVAVRAQRYLDSVRAQAAKMLEQAKIDADQIRRQASIDGRLESEQLTQQMAEKLATKLAAEKVATASATLKQLGLQLEEANSTWLTQWQHETVSLAIGIAEKLIGKQVEHHPEILIQWVSDCLRLASTGRKICLRMNPQTIEHLGSALDSALAGFRSSSEIELVQDPSVHKNGVIAESKDGMLDMQLTTQLARLKQELL